MFKTILLNGEENISLLPDKIVEEFLNRKNLDYRIEYDLGENFFVVEDNYFSLDNVSREDETLINLLKEKYKDKKSFRYINIPKNVDYEIHSCEDNEWIAEKHRVWY